MFSLAALPEYFSNVVFTGEIVRHKEVVMATKPSSSLCLNFKRNFLVHQEKLCWAQERSHTAGGLHV